MIKPAFVLKVSLCLFALAGGSIALAAPPNASPTKRAPGASRAGQAVPAALRPAFYRALAKNAGSAYRIGKDGCAALPKPSLRACFDNYGVHFSGAGISSLALHLVAYGRGGQLTPASTIHPIIKSTRVTYRHGALSEWWRVLPMGFEQGFTLAKRPSGHGELFLALAASGNPQLKDGALVFGRLRYGRLVATDAQGKVIPAKLESKGDRILIAVNDAHAAYPLTIDPLVWIEQKVTASDGAKNDWFGIVSVDGTVAAIGTPYATVGGNPYQGAAYVFSESGGTWHETQKLTPSDAATGHTFGASVAISGTTVVIGAPAAPPVITSTPPLAAAYVFAESGDTWHQTQKLTASDSPTGQSNDFGAAVALDGTTIIVGATYAAGSGDVQGAAYVFAESGGTWQQMQKLTPSDGTAYDLFGDSVALAGATTVIGAPECENCNMPGAAYVFTESGGTWQQTQKLTASDGAVDNQFGWAVALNDPMILVGAVFATVAGNQNQGAAYVFTESGGIWQQAQKLTSNDGAANDFFGDSIALDGTTAVIGAQGATVNANAQQGAAYVFSESGGTWHQTQKLAASDGAAGDNFGLTVALDGTSILIGAPLATVGNNQSQGAAYFEGGSDLDLALSAPTHVDPGGTFVNQTIATNNATAASQAVAVTMAVPAAASFVSATATQGSCSEASGMVNCDFGAIDGNAGTATANVTLKAIGNAGDSIKNTASVVEATPPLTVSTETTIATNSPPVASNGTLTTTENTAASGMLQAGDPDGDSLTFSIVDNPSHGSVTINDATTGSYTYTPASGYSGSDFFTFKANDGQADSNTATISITVKASGGGGSSGGGGGSSGWLSLLALLGLVFIGACPKHRRG